MPGTCSGFMHITVHQETSSEMYYEFDSIIILQILTKTSDIDLWIKPNPLLSLRYQIRISVNIAILHGQMG